MKTVFKILLVVLVLAALAVGGLWLYNRFSAQPAAAFRTAKVTRTDLLATSSATGTLEPQEVVDVGAQVAGIIVSIGDPDHPEKIVDYTSQVQEGQVLARIDPTIYQAELDQAKAQLAQANAGVANANANLAQLQAKLEQAQADWNRAQTLGPSDALSQSAYDAYKAGFDAAAANVKVGHAAIQQADASVSIAQSNVDRAKRNLDYTTIHSPVNGVIIDRRVNKGQTVVSSLSAPSLFLIAKDLTKMQVWVAVNEADIGHIRPKQPVTFTVDAFPDETFHGEVAKVRLNATMTQNVVTYTVEVVADNPSGKLLPYLSANVQFELGRRENVLTVPNSALRWTPKPEQISPQSRTQSSSPAPTTTPGRTRSRKPPADAAAQTQPADRPPETRTTPGTVWVPDGQYVRPVRVTLGLANDSDTQIVSDELKEGDQVVTGELQPGAVGVNNPFAPQFGGRGAGGGGGGRRGP